MIDIKVIIDIKYNTFMYTLSIQYCEQILNLLLLVLQS